MEGNSIKTVIAEDVEIVGSINCASDIQLSGKLNGDLNCTGHALIGDAAVIKGNISATSSSVQGQVNGNVSVKDRIELKSTARINGDIRAKRLTVEDGVTFVGKAEVTPSGGAQGQQTKTDEKGQPADSSEKSGEAGDESKSKSGVFSRK